MANTRRQTKQHRIVAIRRKGKHIEKIKFTDAKGVEMTEWSVDRAVKAVEAGTDEFMVASTVWSPVEVKQRNGVKHLRTVKDSCDHSNLLNLPHF